MEQKELPLSLYAEKAIRAYVFKLIIPTGTALIVVSFLLGFLVQHGAQNEAAKNAFNAANNAMIQSVQNVATAENDARHMSIEVKKIENEAKLINEKLRTAEVFTKSESLVKQVADTLATREDFLSKITNISSQIDSLKLRLDNIQGTIKAAPHNPLPVTGGNTQTTFCPAGSYMIGAKMQSDAGGPHGIISNIFPICKAIIPN